VTAASIIKAISLVIEAARISSTMLNFYRITWCNKPENKTTNSITGSSYVQHGGRKLWDQMLI
jgi:hypothetical protein